MKHEPAFPTTYYSDERPVDQLYGMSLRDYFAGQALIGLTVSAQRAIDDNEALADEVLEKTAIFAYRLAGAMIHESRKERT